MISPDDSTSTHDSSATPPGAKEHLQHIQEEAVAAVQEAKKQGGEEFEHYRDLAADQIDTLVETAKTAASTLDEKDTLGLSHYLTDIAQSLGSLADHFRDKSAEQLLQQGAQLARDNPALFLAGSVAVGFGLSRFLMASAQPPAATGNADERRASSVPDSDYGAQTPYETSFAPLGDELGSPVTPGFGSNPTTGKGDLS